MDDACFANTNRRIYKLHFSNTSPPLEPTDYIIITALSVTHLFLSLLIYKSSTKKSISLEVDALISKVKNYSENIIPDLSNLFKTASIQRLVNYLMLVAIDECINELEKDSKEGKKIDHDALKKCFDKLFTPLVRHRNELFGYGSDAFYNFALYLINENEQELFIAWRSHDNRLQVSNRKWRPGFGHVGLTYIHDEIKICHDISKSTELSSNTQVGSDQNKYKSFLSVPIRDNSFDEGKTKGTHRPIGVLVLGSVRKVLP